MKQALSHYRLFLADEAASCALANNLAKSIFPNLSEGYELDLSDFSGARIYLHGDLGAGKTTFARAFLRALGVKGRIKSPSYTLLESYNVSSLYLYHFDFYRFNDSDEWQEAGFEEQLLERAVVLVEWSEKANEQLPPPDLRLDLTYQEAGREAVLSAVTDKGKQWLNNLNSQTEV
ncbi:MULTISPECIES: tRNA (adenosine(37)-N6)-threonylcarbamoyltransferase complex ATPase subunit type 1 TsaE [Oligella]|uniref:tRNA threonylcarbamoyladenosine biosynthesis protein TsaE n=2 Tax=Oligella urethralis TaxID=90245 RepID=A0A095YVT0_9BURK|nr:MULTISPECIES: tRNA (adenosine(37)-N6)-threonylcarbamoyltransferase complex ATPase subunit type 1 TsaE [Oligella]KGF26271.1 ATPase [Oligella urethralis DNF00040]MDK6203618.1 tRNA (adenosine(37)-N6)-threonylcarbamoyltransferase complex ATPase subunit type 1 TsaE [Oligella urethralis]OFV47081.1 tRNA threonylcarbamoyladenosine biosynthesis protein TsaE [Oligella sp. HMSC09E12]SPY07948.1 ADP-binding protein [Oligella urethralis]SUA61973.1 ADP-binding protein [Oligella urethralis]